jgi:hypothetical protein
LQKLNDPVNHQYPNPDKPVGAKRKSGFIGEPKMINQPGKHASTPVKQKGKV